MANNIAATLKALRKKYNMTQEDLYIKSGLGLRFIRELEQGKETLRLDKVNQLLDFFNYEMVAMPKKRNDEMRDATPYPLRPYPRQQAAGAGEEAAEEVEEKEREGGGEGCREEEGEKLQGQGPGGRKRGEFAGQGKEENGVAGVEEETALREEGRGAVAAAEAAGCVESEDHGAQNVELLEKVV